MTQNKCRSRRDFLQKLGVTVGAAACIPVLKACSRQAAHEPTTPHEGYILGQRPSLAYSTAQTDLMALPMSRPDDWDAIVFNRDRGNAGAIPEFYLSSINGPEGETGHLGKHIPYVPQIDRDLMAEGNSGNSGIYGGFGGLRTLPLMFGDGSLGFARHPASPAMEDGSGGHWYDWIRLRPAVEGEAEEVETRFSGWPELVEGDSGRYAVKGGGEITEDAGRNTIYLVPLPSGVGPGDSVRVIGHCSLHGEYVDFLTLPREMD